MLENIAFFPTKREKNHPIINIESGGRGELRVPTLLSGNVGRVSLHRSSASFTDNAGKFDALCILV